jgi:LPXTG-site transpeptidase (sortase) family protein
MATKKRSAKNHKKPKRTLAKKAAPKTEVAHKKGPKATAPKRAAKRQAPQRTEISALAAALSTANKDSVETSVEASPITEVSRTTVFTTRARKLLRQPLLWVVLINFGLNLLAGAGWHYLYQQTILSFKVSPSVNAELHLRAEEPKQVVVESAGISTTVIPAEISEGMWQTSDTQATHLAASARPSEGGNIVIYAHRRQHLFADLHKAKVGDTIKVTTHDNKIYEYRITNTAVVKPSEVEAVLPTEHEVLTLYTCTGPFDSKRLVVQATASRVASAQ